VSLRAEVAAAAREMHRRGLVAGTAGNVSAREGDRVHITPSGLPYADMSEADVVTLAVDGAVLAGDREPSSERRVHLAVYAGRPDVGAIVHTHSGYATAWSSLAEPLATAVQASEPAPPGSEEIARAAVAALGDRAAALLARHGVLGVGSTPREALAACDAVERQARIAWLRRGLDAHALMAAARRPLVLGIGGGGDVVGALATAELCRLEHGARPVLGGVTWERRPIDPRPGPRPEAEIEGARRLAPAVLAASAATRVAGSGVLFAESRMAGLLGAETVLVDPTLGPRTVAAGVRAAMRQLECDLAVFVDVGGDVLAHGDEPGLGSPLCDAVMLAAAAKLQEAGGPPVLGGVFGVGCDGELTPAEVFRRLDQLGAAGGRAVPPPGRLTAPIAESLEEAVNAVPTEASAMALRAYRGESGAMSIRDGRRTVQLTPEAANTYFFDPGVALASVACLAAAVVDAAGLEAANEALNALGVRTELDFERDVLHTRTGDRAQQ
jgi:ribulose-5-phosphate 4-epimerase/fuculose-1-phosphate aldolase